MFGGDPAAGGLLGPAHGDLHRAGAGRSRADRAGGERAGNPVRFAVHDVKYVQRSSYKDQKLGLYKLLYEPGSRRLLGLHVVAPNAGDIVQGFSLALRLGATVDELARMHHVFPTFGEGVKAAAEHALPEPVEMAAICN